MEESFCALAHWHQVTVDYKGGLVHAVSTDGPHLKFNDDWYVSMEAQATQQMRPS